MALTIHYICHRLLGAVASIKYAINRTEAKSWPSHFFDCIAICAKTLVSIHDLSFIFLCQKKSLLAMPNIQPFPSSSWLYFLKNQHSGTVFEWHFGSCFEQQNSTNGNWNNSWNELFYKKFAIFGFYFGICWWSLLMKQILWLRSRASIA